MMDSVAGAIVIDIPSAIVTRPPRTSRYGESIPTDPSNTSPHAAVHRPNATMRLVPKRSTSRGLSGPPMISTTAIGAIRSPTCSVL